MKRSPMPRGKGFKPRQTTLRATAPAKAETPTARCKAKGCRNRFVKLSMQHRACSPDCAVLVRAQEKAEEVRKAAREHKTKLADSKPLAHWLDLTERVVHAYIHARDRGLPCISCGTRRTVQWEAGHWLSKGARPELRFVADQINLQCHRCNVQLSGNQAKYRIGLVEKIGEARVQELEGPHPPAKFTREALAAIRKEFAALTRQLKAQAA